MANNLVTEAYLAANFSPKSGIIIGSDDHVILNCTEILARYNVTISPSTGNFCPKQSELASSALALAYVGSTASIALLSNPVNLTIAVGAGSKLLVVCIKSVQSVYRTYGVPTFNGVAMTQAGSYSGSYYSEIWYLVNPSVGSYQLSIPNSGTVNLQVSSVWYSYSGTLSLYSASDFDAVSNLAGGNVTVPSNTLCLIITSLTIRLYSTYALSTTGCTDISLTFGVYGGVFGSASQYKIYNTGATTDYNISRTLGNAFQHWYDVVAVFRVL